MKAAEPTQHVFSVDCKVGVEQRGTQVFHGLGGLACLYRADNTMIRKVSELLQFTNQEVSYNQISAFFFFFNQKTGPPGTCIHSWQQAVGADLVLLPLAGSVHSVCHSLHPSLLPPGYYSLVLPAVYHYV